MPSIGVSGRERWIDACSGRANSFSNLRIEFQLLHPSPFAVSGSGFQLPDFYSGATDQLGCFIEGFLLRRLHLVGVEDRRLAEAPQRLLQGLDAEIRRPSCSTAATPAPPGSPSPSS